MPTPWDHVRAAIVLGHLALITVAAFPTPNGLLTKKRRSDPIVLEALAPWSRLVARVGLAEDEAAGSAWLFDRGEDLARARAAAIRPGQRLLNAAGHGSWRMFGVAPADHGRFELHGRFQGSAEWQPLFIEGHPEHRWNAATMDQSRTRSLRSNFAEKALRSRYNRFVRWCADRLMAEHPELVAVRGRLLSVRIPPAKKLRQTGNLVEGDPYWVVEHRREDPR